jgi:hypothetical protein
MSDRSRHQTEDSSSNDVKQGGVVGVLWLHFLCSITAGRLLPSHFWLRYYFHTRHWSPLDRVTLNLERKINLRWGQSPSLLYRSIDHGQPPINPVLEVREYIELRFGYIPSASLQNAQLSLSTNPSTVSSEVVSTGNRPRTDRNRWITNSRVFRPVFQKTRETRERRAYL